MNLEKPLNNNQEKAEVPKSNSMEENQQEPTLPGILSSTVESTLERDEKIQSIREDLKRKFDGEFTLEQKEDWLKLEGHVFDENGFYRVVDEKGFKDFIDTGVVRSSPTGTDENIYGGFNIGNRPTSFPSFSKGSPDLSYVRENSDNYIFESGIPMYKKGDQNPVTQSEVKGRHWAYRPIDQSTGVVITEMTSDMIKNIYKLDKDKNLYLKSK
jgi:hypothetical protein